ncbi:hypothetical protein TKK_0001651 [Trichogramma kaykai]
MEECKGSSTPIDKNVDSNILIKPQSDNEEIEKKCRKLIGSLMYAAMGTRPDICNTILFLSRFQSMASQNLFVALKRVLRYIKGTIDTCLVYKRQNTDYKNVIVGFVDADWGGDIVDRKSTTGYCFLLFNNVISCCSRKQQSTAASTTEAEYIACWLKNLILDLKICIGNNTIVTLFEDSQSAMRVAYNPEHQKRMKHLDIKYHFIREKVNEASDQIADMLTKPLGKDQLKRLRDMIMSKLSLIN